MSEENYKKAYLREREARKVAEVILEEKSLELYSLTESLRQYNANLESKVLERTIELNAIKTEAVKQAKIKADFLSVMSHEMRTPLTSILGYTELLLERIQDEENFEYINRINYSGEVLLSIINTTLENSKFEADPTKLVERNYNLHKELTNLFKIFEIDAYRKKISYTFYIDEKLNDDFLVDLIKIKHIFINLIGNAIKFTDKGSVDVSVKLENLELRAVVIDTGPGISNSNLKKIFKRFGQLKLDFKNDFSGTGLGLHIVKRIIKLMNGSIAVYSKVGEGSRFTFNVLLDKKTVKDIRDFSDCRKKQLSDLSHLKVMVVEDNIINANLFCNILSKRNIVSVRAENGQQCLDYLSRDIDLHYIFLDLRMPLLDGFETARKIRSDFPSFKGKLILLSAELLDKSCVELNLFDDYVLKPFKLEIIWSVFKNFD